MSNQEKKEDKDVVIHIDKNQHKSPTPTTGHALYVLGNVDANMYELWKDVHGNGNDIPISNDTTSIELKNGDHFYSAPNDLNPGSK